ncbi:MAG: hypothetical protein ABR611_16535, partial [Chthoniobacterales bacterium]
MNTAVVVPPAKVDNKRARLIESEAVYQRETVQGQARKLGFYESSASGIEFDYVSPLPAFRPERERDPVARPRPAAWPVVPAEFRGFPNFPAMTEAWRDWREYVFDSDEPLRRRERRLLASV